MERKPLEIVYLQRTVPHSSHENVTECLNKTRYFKCPIYYCFIVNYGCQAIWHFYSKY